MQNARSLCLAATLLVAGSGAVAEPLALVTYVRGEVWTSKGGARRALAPLDWIESGERLGVGAAPSSVRVMLRDGARYELLPGAGVALHALGDLARLRAARRLTDVAAWPVALLASPPPEFAQARGAALRIRARQLQLDAPALGSSLLADRPLAFLFRPVQGATSYAVEVEGPDGRIVERLSTTTGGVTLPAGRLLPGVVYHWSVRSQGGVLGQARGRGVFRTLTAEDADRATRLLGTTAAADGALVSAELHRQLGWDTEAREGQPAELEQAPGQAGRTAASRHLDGPLEPR